MEPDICEDCGLVGVQVGLLGYPHARWCHHCAELHDDAIKTNDAAAILDSSSVDLVELWCRIVMVAAEQVGRSESNRKAYVGKSSMRRQFELLGGAAGVRDTICSNGSERETKLIEAIGREDGSDRKAKLALASLRAVLQNALRNYFRRR